MGELHISLAAERLGTFLGIPITNTLITEWSVMLILVIGAFFIGRNPTMIPSKVQAAFEWVFEYVLQFMEETLGSRSLAIRFFPLIATIFLFILLSNWFDFIPFMGAIGFYLPVGEGKEFVPLFRAVNTDLNVTLAMAAIAYLVIEITGIVTLGFLKYGSKFVNFKQGAIGFFMGLIEFVSNLARLVSFSFRLFGNVFAGEVLIAVIVSFLPFVLPVPLMLFETFVGFVQAAIFALLTLVFIKIAISEPHGEAAH
ncbi:MAG TPA: F0F1 ATP synthase subunit A [Candidatus Paceibacterota bacterium]|nr:F0F1 ATP synthase subunit A [Candidatus Paceibacterota bacterium]